MVGGVGVALVAAVPVCGAAGELVVTPLLAVS